MQKEVDTEINHSEDTRPKVLLHFTEIFFPNLSKNRLLLILIFFFIFSQFAPTAPMPEILALLRLPASKAHFLCLMRLSGCTRHVALLASFRLLACNLWLFALIMLPTLF